MIVKPSAINFRDFTITITLADDHPDSKSITYSFKIIITKALQENPTENQNNNTSNNTSGKPSSGVSDNTSKDFKA